MLRQILSKSSQTLKSCGPQRCLSAAAGSSKGVDKNKVLNNADIPIVDFQDPDYLPLPEYPFRPNEPLNIRKQRLIYQSRKRGMLENDLLLSTFAHKHLEAMSEKQVVLYDQLINGVTNDWDIYYWATNTKPTPQEYDNEVMAMLKEHVKNADRNNRCRQLNLN